MKKGFENISAAINNAVKTNENGVKSKFLAKEKEILVLLKNKYQNAISVQMRQAQNGKYIVDVEFTNDKVKDKQYIAGCAEVFV